MSVQNASNEIITVIGNRPQFIKMAPVSKALRNRGFAEFIVHTGQHHDENMSQIFFDELEIPKPHLNLGVPSGNHGAMTAFMLEKIEEVLLERKPKGVLIYGDTNSTLAATLAAVKLHIPIAHVESGPRTYDMTSPEEVNRVIADHVCQLRFCPDEISVDNLAKENITQGVHFTGDVMYDAYLQFSTSAQERSDILERFEITDGSYALLTAHRPNNTDTLEALSCVVELIKKSPIPVVFPVHPRTEAALKKYQLWEQLITVPHAKIIPAVGYLDMLQLTNHARIILTDSGGLQKEGFFAGKPVVILFYTTPWPQIESSVWQKLAWRDNGIDVEKILSLINDYPVPSQKPHFFGDGHAAEKIVSILEKSGWFTTHSKEMLSV